MPVLRVDEQQTDNISASNPNLRQTELPHEESCGSSNEAVVSAFDQAVNELSHDKKVQEDLHEGKRVGLYHLYESLAAGNFAQVKLAHHILTGDKVAMKIVNKCQMDEQTRMLLSREVSNMEKLHHPNVIRLYEVLETLSTIHLAMEFAAGGDLMSRVISVGRFQELTAKTVFAQLVAAVEHLYSYNIVHRDIKAENVLFAIPLPSESKDGLNIWMKSNKSTTSHESIPRYWHIKLVDFGFSREAKMGDQLTTFCGSPPYASPELFTNDWYSGPPVDIWAMGVLLYFILTGMMPFQAPTLGRLKRLILAGNYICPGWLHPMAKHLIRQCLRLTPENRITLASIRCHPWLKERLFPAALKPYPTTPRAFIQHVENTRHHNSWLQTHNQLEKTATQASTTPSDAEGSLEVERLLSELGIHHEHLMKHRESQGAHSHVTGAYRIVLHRVHKQRRLSHLLNLHPTVHMPHPITSPLHHSRIKHGVSESAISVLLTNTLPTLLPPSGVLPSTLIPVREEESRGIRDRHHAQAKFARHQQHRHHETSSNTSKTSSLSSTGKGDMEKRRTAYPEGDNKACVIT